MSLTPQSLGAALRRARERAGMTQRCAATWYEISSVHLCNIERGHCLPSMELLIAMAVQCGVPLSDIILEAEQGE